MPRQTRVFCPSHDQKQPDEKYQKAPVNFLVDEVRIASPGDEQNGCANGGDHSRGEAHQESGENQCCDNTSFEQRGVLNSHDIHGGFGADIMNTTTEVE